MTIRSSLLLAGKASNSVLLLRHISFLALFHDVVNRELNCISLPQDNILAHCLGNIMLMRPSEHELAATIDLVVRRLHVRHKFRGLLSLEKMSRDTVV